MAASWAQSWDPSSCTRTVTDTPGEADYFRNGGILQYVLRQLAKA